MAQAALANGSLVLEGTRAEAGRYQCEATIPGIGTILSRIARVSFQGTYYTVCTVPGKKEYCPYYVPRYLPIYLLRCMGKGKDLGLKILENELRANPKRML